MSSAIFLRPAPLPLAKSGTSSPTSSWRDTIHREKAPSTHDTSKGDAQSAPVEPMPPLNVFMLVEMSAETSTQLQLEMTTLEVEEGEYYDEYLASAEMEAIYDINELVQEHAADGGEGEAVDIAFHVANAVHLIGAAAIRLTS